MKGWLGVVIGLSCYFTMGCDSDQVKQADIKTRTMIIGGVPVHEHDYKRPKSSLTTQQQAIQP